MATESHASMTTPAATTRNRAGRRRGNSGPDRVTVMLCTLAAFLVVLALLADQMRVASAGASHPVPVVLRKVYRTTVIETILGGSGRSGTSVSQSVSGSPVAAVAPAPTTRTS